MNDLGIAYQGVASLFFSPEKVQCVCMFTEAPPAATARGQGPDIRDPFAKLVQGVRASNRAAYEAGLDEDLVHAQLALELAQLREVLADFQSRAPQAPSENPQG